VEDMGFMFQLATSFNQSLCDWRSKVDFSNLGLTGMLDNSGCESSTLPTSSTSPNWCKPCTS
jgi:hypothetical protein